MSYIENIVEDGSILKLKINNESGRVNTSLVNSLRRTIMSNIRTWCINPVKCLFLENTSILDNEFIAHRLSLVPIRCNISDLDYHSLHFECRKKNEEDELMSVYPEDFVITDRTTKKQIQVGDIFPYPKILLLELRYQQSVAFECELMENSVEEGGASIHCPVCTCVHVYGVNQNEVKDKTKSMSEEEKRTFFTNEVQRTYAKNKQGEPDNFEMTIETIEQFTSREIVIMSIDLLKIRLNRFINDLKVRNERITIEQGSVYEDITEISVDGETDTLGNLVSNYMGKQDNVVYSGYIIRHPLRKNMLLKVKLGENNTIDNIIEKYDVVVRDLNETLDKIKEELTV